MASRRSKSHSRSKSPGREKSPTGRQSRGSVGNAGKTIVVTERRIESGPRAIYQCLSTGISTTPTQIHQGRDGLGGQRGTSSFAGTAAGYVRAVFLPDGYPQSVSDDYMPYQLWDTLQAFCSTITGILAQRAMLTSMGVGNNAAKVTAALWQTTVRRNIGKVARITFTTFKGTDLDSNCKAWRIVADVLNDMCTAIEVLSPMLCLAHSDCNAQWLYFVWVCAAEVFRSIVGVAGGASRAALTQHFSKADNFGDVNAKDGSQEMFVEILGSGLGMIVSDVALESDHATKWAIFSAFTLLHVYANVRACRSVCLRTFNRQRAHIVVDQWLRDRTIPAPEEVQRREQTVYFGGSQAKGVSIVLGATVSQLAHGDFVGQIRKQQQQEADADSQRYLICDVEAQNLLMGSSRRIMVGVSERADQVDLLRAYLHASLLARTRLSVDQAGREAADIMSRLGPRWTQEPCHLSPAGTRLGWDL